jgi:5-methyltetrahydrofolate--homocysteine methyltransferase
MRSLLASLKNRGVLLSDGAWGTMLHEKGLQAGDCPELWNITHRKEVLSIAKSYIDAGSDLILTNSFGGNSVKLRHYDLQDRMDEINEAAAAISREAAGKDHLVLGSMGPSGAILMMGEVSGEELMESFSRQSEALKRGGADAICIETMSDIDEACIAIRAAKKTTGMEIVCTFTFEKTVGGEFRTMMGVSPEEMTSAVKEAGADVIGTNCGNGFDQMIDIVSEIRKFDPVTPVLVHANAGKPILKDGSTLFPETPEMMAAKIGDLINCGTSIIGGCCGTTPEHIRALAKAIKKEH